jgi:hypothetical protein
MHFNGIDAERLMSIYSPDTLCIVVGDADCKHKEYAQARALYPDARLMVLNDSGRGFDPKLVPDFVVTMHCAVNNFIATPRMPLSRIPDTAAVYGWHCNGDQHERVDEVFSADPIWGTCALFGVLCAFHCGFERVLLAGCPLDGPYGSASKLNAWRQWKPWFIGRVEALSGNVRKVLYEEA